MDEDGYTRLPLRAEVVTALLAAGADSNARDEDGDTPLRSAGYRADAEAVTALVNAGADLNAKDNDGRTPLQRATKRGHLRVAALLK